MLIGDQQKGVIPRRNISECTREIFDYMWKYQENESPGLILQIDLEKAFDSLAWDFIHLVFKDFAFPKLICNYIQFFQQGANSRVSHNNWLLDSFSLHRGCRQGNPVSPYIFILCAEYLSQSIKNNRDIIGLNICGKEKKLTQFADDTSLFLNPSKKVLQKTLQTLSDFEQVSGLKINLSKTKAVWIGSERFRDDGICHDPKLD